MKFSDREKQILQILKKKPNSNFTLDEIIKQIEKQIEHKPKFFRRSVTYSMHKLSEKLSIFGIDLVMISPIGRGHKATYYISERVSNLIT